MSHEGLLSLRAQAAALNAILEEVRCWKVAVLRNAE
jgi:hypothetical protein